ncbi:MAG: MGMT family protein [Sporichthyaceae bacterium]
MDEDFAEAVLALVESIPEGRVLAYGDIAAILGAGGPRRVGAVLSHSGGGVPWWRVPKADGSPPPGKEAHCARRWHEEGTPLRPNGKVDMNAARWLPAG